MHSSLGQPLMSSSQLTVSQYGVTQEYLVTEKTCQKFNKVFPNYLLGRQMAVMTQPVVKPKTLQVQYLRSKVMEVERYREHLFQTNCCTCIFRSETYNTTLQLSKQNHWIQYGWSSIVDLGHNYSSFTDQWTAWALSSPPININKYFPNVFCGAQRSSLDFFHHIEYFVSSPASLCLPVLWKGLWIAQVLFYIKRVWSEKKKSFEGSFVVHLWCEIHSIGKKKKKNSLREYDKYPSNSHNRILFWLDIYTFFPVASHKHSA